MSVTSFILDGLILVLLAATIVYVARLSLALKAFKDNHKILEKLLESLAETIDQAERSVAGLQVTSRDMGRDLQTQMDEAQAMIDELQLMNEAGNNLASRLEQLADRGSAAAQKTAPAMPLIEEDEDEDALFNAPSFEPKREDGPSFFIRDPEYDRGEIDDGQGLFEGDDAVSGGLQSRAERELYEALQSHHGKTGGRA